MLKLDNPAHKDIFEAIYDPRIFELSNELKKVDSLLDHPQILAPFREKFAKKRGRPTVAVATYLRLMYLKSRYQLGYETLVEEVSDHMKWRKFCRISLDKTVPDSTTLVKLTQKYGRATIDAVNNRLLHQLRSKKVLQGKKLRIDTTVVQSNIHYPTDIGLLSDGIRKIARIVKRIRQRGVAAKTRFRDRTRTVKKTILNYCKNLRKKTISRKEDIKERTKKLLMIARGVVRQAQCVARDAAAGAVSAGTKRLLDDPERFVNITQRLQRQTKNVLSNKGDTVKSRLVSIFDTTARPIKKGKLGIRAEFGNKVIVQDTAQGIITDYRVREENPGDATLVDEAVERHIAVFGKPPDEIATDRGFSSAENEARLQETIKRVSMPKRGRLDKPRKQYQRQYWFRRLQRFRAGGEAKISLLKRKFGLRRSRLRGLQGMGMDVGWGILAHNLWQTVRIT